LRFIKGASDRGDEVECSIDGETERRSCPDPLAIVDERLKESVAVHVDGLPRFHGGALGYLGFDLIRCYEEVGPRGEDPYDLPLGHLAICDTLVVFDHVKHTIKVVSHARLDGDIEAEYRAASERIDATISRLRSAPLSVSN